MLTSYDREEFLYQYLDSEADQKLVESIMANSMKAVKSFQKTFYQEPVKAEPIPLASWRMKEKAFFTFKTN